MATNVHTDAPGFDAERRRIRRWLYTLGAVLAVAVFGRLRYENPTVTTRSGATYEIAAIGRRTMHGSPTAIFKYVTRATDSAAVSREMREILPYAQAQAQWQGDTLLVISAAHRKFRYGLFVVDTERQLWFRRVKGRWYPEQGERIIGRSGWRG
jgi:hypothetical protein